MKVAKQLTKQIWLVIKKRTIFSNDVIVMNEGGVWVGGLAWVSSDYRVTLHLPSKGIFRRAFKSLRSSFLENDNNKILSRKRKGIVSHSFIWKLWKSFSVNGVPDWRIEIFKCYCRWVVILSMLPKAKYALLWLQEIVEETKQVKFYNTAEGSVDLLISNVPRMISNWFHET